jgi:PAS domain S-box-containing protein
MYKLLIVEDTLTIREELLDILTLEGYQVFQAENGSVGFKKALKEHPDLIISEAVLPKLSGLEMLKKLNKKTTTNIPLIFLSKKNKKEDVRNGMNAGAEDYLEKPFDKEELIAVVKRVLKKQQLRENRIQKVIDKDNYFQKEASRRTKLGYWTYDKQSNTRTWSKVVREIFGMNQEEIPSYDIMLNCLGKNSRTKHHKASINLAKNGESYDMEFEIKNLKNEKRWIQDIGEPIYNFKNKIIGHRGIIRDITVIKKNQDALHLSNERFEMVGLANNNAVWDWNILNGKIYRNRANFNEVYGINSKRPEEETYQAGAYIHLDDQKRIAEELEKLIASLNVNNFSLEYRTPNIEGKYVHIEDNGYIVRNSKGKAIRMIGSASNITKRKKAEQLMIDEKEIMEKIATNETLKTTLKAITLAIEKQIDNSICSILLLDLDGVHLRHGAAPNLPKDYNLAIDGMAIGVNKGSCGTAAYKKKPVFVSDIATDPLWENYKKLALSHGLKACWSFPIISKKEDIVLATFAIYYTSITTPNPLDIELLKQVSNFIRIAIEKNTSNKKLINSETRYRNLFERNLAGTYQKTIDGKILKANTTFANIHGYETSEKILEQHASTFYFSEEEREIFIKNLKKNKKLINREKIVKHKNGSIIYVLENCYLQKDPLLGVDIIEGIIIDITERKKAEEVLIEYKHFFDNTANFSCIANVQGYFEVINPNFEKVLGYTEKELLENQFLSFIHPEDIDATLKEIEKLQNGNKTIIFKNRYRTKDGNYLWFEWNATHNPVNGKIYAVARDITKQISTEKEKQQLFALIETSQEIISFGDLTGKPIFINKAGRHLLGIDENTDFSTLHFSDFFPEEEENNFSQKEIESFFFQKGRWEKDTKVINLKTKEKIAVYISAFVIKDNITGKAIGLGSVSMDITERIKVKNELIEAKEQAERLIGFKDQFLANMSHEIRTPLNGIIGFNKILLRSNLTKKQKEQLTAIKVSSDILLVVINDILDLAKIEAGKMVLEKTQLKIGHVINSVLSTFELRIKEKEQTLHTHYDKNIPDWVLGDPIRINQIVLNLIENAIKFTNVGGKINIQVNLLKEEGDTVIIEIKISDTGIGIPEDKIENIFDTFTQGNDNIPRKYGGSGLGLNIVKQLINLMKGTISVKSQLHIGSTFRLTIPLIKIKNASIKIDETVSNNYKLEFLDQLKGLEKLKILIVDDMVINQLLAKTILEDIGFETAVAENGKVAIKLLKKNTYDVILMDLQMPEMNGWEATHYIRNKMDTSKSSIPIIALTADVTQKSATECIKAGMDEYVSKPINETDLLNKVIRLVTYKRNTINQKQQEATKICNLTSLRSKPKFLKVMLEIILKELPVTMKQLATAFENNDWKDLSLKIHSIKPTLSLMGLPNEIISISKQIEENTKKEEHLDLLPAQFIKLEKALEKGCKELEEELNALKN